MHTEELKKVFKWGSVVLLVLAVFLGAEALGALRDLRQPSPVYNTISVTGEGEAVGIPDVAQFSFTISANAKAVSEAQAQVTSKMNELLAELKAMGIEDRDVKTLSYSVYPRYTYTQLSCTPTYCPPVRQVQDGYNVEHTISLKIRRTEEAGTVLALVGERGATNISSIAFTIDDEDSLKSEARDLAIKDAQDKAKELSKSLRVKLVKVIGFYDNSDGGVSPLYRESAVFDSASGAPAPRIPTGENTYRSNITLIYEIR